MPVDHPNLEILSFTVNYEDGTTFEVQVKDVEFIEFRIPEDTTYQMTIHFKVKGKTLRDLKYRREVKAYGIVVRNRELNIGLEFVPSESIYDVTFEKDTTPKGMMLRGDYSCTSTYYANGEELFMVPWKLSVTKK